MGNGYLRAEYEALRSDTCEKEAQSPMQWVMANRARRGTVLVSASGFKASEVQAQLRIPSGRPAEPTALLLLRGQCAVRLDVNGSHAGHENRTHLVAYLQVGEWDQWRRDALSRVSTVVDQGDARRVARMAA